MRQPGLAPFVAIWCYVLYSLLVTYVEIPLVAEEHRIFFAVGKLLILIVTIPCAFVLRRRPRTFWANAVVGLSLAIYPSFSEWFRINYEFAFFQLLTAYALLFRPTRALFFSIVALSAISFTTVFWYRFPYLEAQLRSPAPSDSFLTIGAFSLVVIIVYLFYNYERSWRESALNRFGLIGRHASSIIHDVKNLVAMPAMQVESLKRKIANQPRSMVHDSLDEIDTSLASTSKLIYDLNQMARLAESHTEDFEVRDVIVEILELLKYKLRGIAFSLEGEMRLRGDRSLMYSVLLNLFLNSIEHLLHERIEKPRIEVRLGKNSCLFVDNGRGFDSGILVALRSGLSRTTKDHGSGLGLFLVSAAVEDLGGRAGYSNAATGGAVIQLDFN